MVDEPKKLLLDLSGLDDARRPSRKSHNLYLDSDQFKLFRQHCEKLGLSASRVLDRLIAAYLAAEKENPGQDRSQPGPKKPGR